ncbi:MAG: hypothetical protein AAGJ35_10165 [Myxococcota bacterium]
MYSYRVMEDLSLICLDAGRDLMGLIAEDKDALLTLPNITEKDFTSLGELRLAVWAAEVAMQISSVPETAQQLREKVQQLRENRTRLFGVINLIWPEDAEMQELMIKLKRGTGYADLANDGLALSQALNQREAEMGTWVNLSQMKTLLENTSMLAGQIMELRKSPKDPEELEKTKEKRDSLYAMFEARSNEIARAGRFLWEDKDEVRFEAYAPLYRVYLRNARKSGPTETTDTNTPA